MHKTKVIKEKTMLERLRLLFGKKKKIRTYDPAVRKPVIKASICTGEKVAGFVGVHNGHFEEVMLIRNQKDLDDFRDMYDIKGEIETIY